MNKLSDDIEIYIPLDEPTTFIYNDVLSDLINDGDKIKRASHVEPADDGGWIADMSPLLDNHPEANFPRYLGPFPLRSEALNAEVEWIHMFFEWKYNEIIHLDGH